MWNDVDNTHEFDHFPNGCDTMAAIHAFFCSFPQEGTVDGCEILHLLVDGLSHYNPMK
jgi:hypothetical protein